MSSGLRFAVIAVLVLATGLLGIFSYNSFHPKPVVALTEPAPPMPELKYYVTTKQIPAGTFLREDDVKAEALPAGPPGSFREIPADRIKLKGALTLKDLGAGSPITPGDILGRSDRGFLARVLAPGMRAVAVNVDVDIGVARGMLFPGDRVDVQILHGVGDKNEFDKLSRMQKGRTTLVETTLHDVRVVSVDTDIVQGGQATSATPATMNVPATRMQAVSLEVTPEGVRKLAVARQLGTLSLSIRSARDEEASDYVDPGYTGGIDVSQTIACQEKRTTTVTVYSGGSSHQYEVMRSGGPTNCVNELPQKPPAPAQKPPEAGVRNEQPNKPARAARQ